MELAHKYIDGLASEEEILQIKEQLKQSPAFRKEFMRLQAMKAMLKADERMEQKKELNALFDRVVQPKLDKEAPPKRTKVISLKQIGLLAAAAIALLLVATVFLTPSQLSGNELYAAYYEPYPVSIERGEAVEGGEDELLQRAIEQYSLKNYPTAEKYLQQIITAKYKLIQPNKINMLLGNVMLIQGNTEAAIDHFKQILTTAPNQYTQDAKWFLAMAYLKANQEELALQQLTEIANTMNIYQVEAQKVLNKWGK